MQFSHGGADKMLFGKLQVVSAAFFSFCSIDTAEQPFESSGNSVCIPSTERHPYWRLRRGCGNHTPPSGKMLSMESCVKWGSHRNFRVFYSLIFDILLLLNIIWKTDLKLCLNARIKAVGSPNRTQGARISLHLTWDRSGNGGEVKSRCLSPCIYMGAFELIVSYFIFTSICTSLCDTQYRVYVYFCFYHFYHVYQTIPYVVVAFVGWSPPECELPEGKEGFLCVISTVGRILRLNSEGLVAVYSLAP